MTDVTGILVDGRQAVRNALSAIQTDLAFTVRGSYPRSTDDGVIITVGEYTNVATDCPVVDEIAYQIDLWAFDRETVVALSEQVNRTLTNLGLRRQYAGPDTVSDDPAGYCRKTFRFGRKVDKRTMRLIDG